MTLRFARLCSLGGNCGNFCIIVITNALKIASANLVRADYRVKCNAGWLGWTWECSLSMSRDAIIIGSASVKTRAPRKSREAFTALKLVTGRDESLPHFARDLLQYARVTRIPVFIIFGKERYGSCLMLGDCANVRGMTRVIGGCARDDRRSLSDE